MLHCWSTWTLSFLLHKDCVLVLFFVEHHYRVEESFLHSLLRRAPFSSSSSLVFLHSFDEFVMQSGIEEIVLVHLLYKRITIFILSRRVLWLYSLLTFDLLYLSLNVFGGKRLRKRGLRSSLSISIVVALLAALGCRVWKRNLFYHVCHSRRSIRQSLIIELREGLVVYICYRNISMLIASQS